MSLWASGARPQLRLAWVSGQWALYLARGSMMAFPKLLIGMLGLCMRPFVEVLRSVQQQIACGIIAVVVLCPQRVL